LIQADTVGMGQAVTDMDVEYAKSKLPNLTHVKMNGLDHGLGLDTWEVPQEIEKEVMKYLEYVRP